MAYNLGITHGLWAPELRLAEAGDEAWWSSRACSATAHRSPRRRFDYRRPGNSQTGDVTELSRGDRPRGAEDLRRRALPRPDFRERFLAGVDETGQTRASR